MLLSKQEILGLPMVSSKLYPVTSAKRPSCIRDISGGKRYYVEFMPSPFRGLQCRILVSWCQAALSVA